jgi:hypothetical protein
VTHVSDGRVPDAVYDEARAAFDEKALANLTLDYAFVRLSDLISLAC